MGVTLNLTQAPEKTILLIIFLFATSEGIQVDSITTSYGLSQIISDPTHILPNSSSCIDLIFTNQPNLVTENGVYPSLHPKCHHQIVFAKLNLNVEYPPLYERLIWD